METKGDLVKFKRCLILMDVINAFLKKGNLADPETQRIIPYVVELIKDFMETGDPIIAFADAHSKDSIEFLRFLVHSLIGTEEAEFIEEIKPYEKYFIVFRKNSVCGFVLPEFQEYLNSEQLKDINEVVLCGVCADICDISFLLPLRGYFDQNNRNVRIIVPKNAVDTFNIPGHNRDEWNEMAFKFINQVGIETPHTYKKEMK